MSHIRYARGPYCVEARIPSSAFSKGDLLCYDSNSSLSRMPDTFGLPLAGVALSASTSSYRNKVEYVIPAGDTEFYSECTTGSQFTAGENFDFEYTSNRFMVSTSVNSAIANVIRGTQDVDGQSNRSMVLLRFRQPSSITLLAHDS